MSNVFKYVEAICNHEEISIGNDYNQYFINKYFSYFRDTVLVANMANRFEMDNEVHFMLYFNLIPKKKRFNKWYKSTMLEDIKLIAKHFDISYREASLYKNMIDEDDVKELKGIYNE